MAEKETSSLFNRAGDVVKALYTVVEQQKRNADDINTLRTETRAEIAEIRENVRAMREHSLETERRIGTLEAQFKNVEAQAKERHDALLKSVEEQRSTIDAKIQAAKSDMNAELYKAKLEMNAELQKAKAEMTAEFHKAKSEAMTDLNRAFTKFAFDFSRESGGQPITAVTSQRPAIESAPSDEREPK